MSSTLGTFDRAAFLAGVTSTALVPGAAWAADERAGLAEIPIDLVNNRPFAGLRFTGPRGTAWGRTWLDTGGGSLIMTAPLLRTIGLLPAEMSATFTPCSAPAVRVGSATARIDQIATFAIPTASVSEFAECAAFTNPFIFERMRLDYPGRRLIIGDAVHGAPVNSTIAVKSRFPRVEVTIGGKQYGMLLDTGAACTMLSEAVIAEIGAGWRTRRGAYGYANMVGGEFDARASTVRIPRLEFAGGTLTDVVCVSRPRGTFERSMARYMDGPIVGAIGGNVLKHYMVEIDYAARVVALTGSAASEASLNQVPLVITAKPLHVYEVAAADPALFPGAAQVPQPGDRIESVDGKPSNRLGFPALLDALRGAPGERKQIGFRRGERAFTLTLAVQPII